VVHSLTKYLSGHGDVLLALLHAGFFGDVDNVVELEADRKVLIGVLQPLLQTYFPEWKNTLLVPEWGFREGTYIFVVSLGSIRNAELPPNRLRAKTCQIPRAETPRRSAGRRE
jgi:hypothetical protein